MVSNSSDAQFELSSSVLNCAAVVENELTLRDVNIMSIHCIYKQWMLEYYTSLLLGAGHVTRVPHLGPRGLRLYEGASGPWFSFVVQNENKIVCQTEAVVVYFQPLYQIFTYNGSLQVNVN